MGQWDIYNEVLLSLHERSSSFSSVGRKYEAVCEHLRLDNLIFSIAKENETVLGDGKTVVSDKYTVYAIHPEGIKLIDSLPEEYKSKPYEYFLKLKQDKLHAEVDFKELINKVNRATIETTKWTKLMFIATLVIAIGTIILAIYPLTQGSDESKNIQQIQDRLQRLEDRTLPDNPSKHSDSPAISRTQTLDSSKKPSLKK